METSTKAFNLQETIDLILGALNGVISHIFFDAALHGLLVACAVALLALALKSGSKTHLSKPFFVAACRLAIFCAFLSIPGFINLFLFDGLPETGYYNVNSLGFIGFWSLASVWLCGEQLNYQWYTHSEPEDGAEEEQIKQESDKDSDSKAKESLNPSEKETSDPIDTSSKETQEQGSLK